MTDEYLSINEAAAQEGVSRATMWRWIRLHQLQTYRFGNSKQTFIRSDDIPRLYEAVPRHKESRPPDESE